MISYIILFKNKCCYVTPLPKHSFLTTPMIQITDSPKPVSGKGNECIYNNLIIIEAEGNSNFRFFSIQVLLEYDRFLIRMQLNQKKCDLTISYKKLTELAFLLARTQQLCY